MSPLRHLLGVASIGLLVTSVVGLATRDDPAPTSPAGPAAVTINDFVYGPETLDVAVGTNVTWTNDDTTAHTVDFTTTTEEKSGSIEPGETFEYAVEAVGTYEYFCALHPFMKGSIEVTG